MRAVPAVLVLAAALAASAASAQPQPPPRHDPRYEPTPQERALEQADRILRQMQDLLRAIPSYDPPVVTPEGDILIRRRPPHLPPPERQPYPPPSPGDPPAKL